MLSWIGVVTVLTNDRANKQREREREREREGDGVRNKLETVMLGYEINY